MLLGIDLPLFLIPVKPSLILLISWSVLAKIIMSLGSSDNFFSATWFDDIKIDPSSAIKYSHVEISHIESSFIFFEKEYSNLNPLVMVLSIQINWDFYQLFSLRIKAMFLLTSSWSTEYKNLPPLLMKLCTNLLSVGVSLFGIKSLSSFWPSPDELADLVLFLNMFLKKFKAVLDV